MSAPGWTAALLGLPRRLRRLAGLSPRGRGIVLEALGALVVARLWLMARRFEAVAGKLGRPLPAAAEEAIADLPDPAADEARSVSSAVRWVARYVPFRAMCLQQGIAAKLMLRRRRIPATLYFGVSRSSESGRIVIAAHAWLRAGQVEVTGYDVASEYRAIARFE